MAGYLERLKTKKRLPQALPKLPKGENTPTPGTAKTAKSPFDSKDSGRGRHISEKPQEIPAPSPPGLGYEYDDLWNKAWILADFVDGDTAPYADRKARLPELMQMRDRMAEIANRGTNVPNGENPTATSDSEEIKQIKQDGCPAKCKRSGKCYARAYFEGKPGKAAECDPAKCERHIPGLES